MCQVVDSVSALGEAAYYPGPGPAMSASSNNPRFARQAEPLMPYRYGYAVQDDIGNDFNQQEQSDGAQVITQVPPRVPTCLTWPMYTGDRAVQRPPPRRPDPDRDLQREARDRLRGEWYLVAQLLSLFDAFHELSPQCLPLNHCH